MIAAAAGAFGLLLGSFLNVVAHRLPRKASVVTGRSACPACGAQVRAYDNVPVVSWLLLRGRCRSCAAPISAKYPVVEAGTAVLMAAVALVHADDTTKLVLGLVLVAFLVPLTLIDIEHQILPNVLTGAAAVTALVLGLALDPGGEPERLIAGVAAGGFLLVAALIRPGGMGMGDVKLAGVLGLFLGAPVAIAMLVAFLSGSLVGAAIMARKGVTAGRKTKVPFGPFLALGGVVAILVGAELIDAYTSTFA